METISYNLSTEVISLWDNKIYLDLDLKNVDDTQGAEGEEDKVELSETEKQKGFLLLLK